LLKDLALEDLRVKSMKFKASRTELLSFSNSSAFERVSGSKFNCMALNISRSGMSTNGCLDPIRSSDFRGERSPKVFYSNPFEFAGFLIGGS